jgi:putative aldouronate transport system substrate-binding protein
MRRLVLIAAVSLFVAAFAGTAWAQNADRMKISVALWDMNLDYQKSDDAVYALIQKKLNIDIDPVVITWDDYAQKINLWAASGDLPDVFNIDAYDPGTNLKTFYSWVKNGTIKALPDNLSRYPNAAKIFAQPDVKAMKVNGKFWAWPRMLLAKPDPFGWARNRVAFIRIDWLNKLGLKEPTTFDEFYAVVKKIQNGDPEGDGKKITGIVTYDVAFLYWIMSAFCPAEFDQWVKDSDGLYKPAFFTRDMVEALKAVRKLYVDGLLDQDYAIEKTDEGMAKFMNGKAATIMYQLGGPADFNFLGDPFEKGFPGKKAVDSIKVLHNLKNLKYGKAFSFNYPSWWSEAYINGKVNDAKADRILQLFDYTASPEYLDIVNWGFEGKDYTKSGGKYVITRPKNDKGAFIALTEEYKFLSGWSALGTWGNAWVGFNDPSIDPKLAAMGNSFIEWNSKNLALPDQSFDAVFTSTPLKDNFKFDLGADMNRIIVDSSPVEQAWQKAVDTYKAKGLDQMLAELNKALKDKGVK